MTLFRYFRRLERLRRRGRAIGAYAGQLKPKAASHLAARYWRAVLGLGAYLLTGIAALVSVAYFLGILDRTEIFSGNDVLGW